MTDHPVTLAVRALRAGGVAFEPFTFTYEPHGGTRHSAEMLGVDEHAVIKTLIFEDDAKKPLCVLMHGDREVSARGLARQIGARSAAPCNPEVAEKHSGYKVGGTSPFGLKKPMPIYLERSIVDLDAIYINGGARGFLVKIDPHELVRVLAPKLVEAATT
ncbi:MAG: aminoacyl-tRNA deacylase [Polyangiaceae bacterium]|nr:aminoacyl-tRNA deacylase [Polyangiaceae bacterium]